MLGAANETVATDACPPSKAASIFLLASFLISLSGSTLIRYPFRVSFEKTRTFLVSKNSVGHRKRTSSESYQALPEATFTTQRKWSRAANE